MNVYEKLIKARLLFQKKGVKKTGVCKSVKVSYTYFELDDILPVCNKISEEVKAVCVVSFSETMATLDFVDTEKPEDKIVFTCPMSTARLNGCHDVQNVGAVQTFLKRYLYQNAFEIAESDIFGASQNTGHNPQAKPTEQPQGQAQKPQGQPQANKWTMTPQQSAFIKQLMESEYNTFPIFSEERKMYYRRKLTNCTSNLIYDRIKDEAQKEADTKVSEFIKIESQNETQQYLGE